MTVDTPVCTDSWAMPALVLGASGFLGSHIARQLCAASRATRAMVRESSDTSAIDDLSLERCVGDVSDVQSLQQAMRGCGTVFYCVVDTRAWLSEPAPLYRTNVEGLRNALDAAHKEGVQRFVFTSSMATESSVPKPASRSRRTTWLARAFNSEKLRSPNCEATANRSGACWA